MNDGNDVWGSVRCSHGEFQTTFVARHHPRRSKKRYMGAGQSAVELKAFRINNVMVILKMSTSGITAVSARVHFQLDLLLFPFFVIS